MKSRPSFNEEQILWKQGYNYVIGIDEVGRGAFAGPVVAAGVVFKPCERDCTEMVLCARCDLEEIKQINDSKLLLPKKRELLSIFLRDHVLAYSIVEVSVPWINKVGIGKATQIAFRKVVNLLKRHPELVSGSPSIMEKMLKQVQHDDNRGFYVLIDGFPVEGIAEDRQKAIVKGDQKSISIAAASIIAKVYRDTLMSSFLNGYSVYDFKTNKGYGTLKHRAAIKNHGLSDLHRTSFSIQL